MRSRYASGDGSIWRGRFVRARVFDIDDIDDAIDADDKNLLAHHL